MEEKIYGEESETGSFPTLDKDGKNADDSEFAGNKDSSPSENIDFNEFDIESVNEQAITLGNVIEDPDDDNKSSKVKILCQEIISEATENSPQSVLLLPVKTMDIEKDASNLVGETKHMSEFICNEVYLNSQLIDDLSIFTDNSNFNRDNNLASTLTTPTIKIISETEKPVAISNQPFNTSKLPQSRPSKSNSILKNKSKEEVKSPSSPFKLKRIKKKVSFNEAELVNNVKKRRIFINNQEKKSNKRMAADQVFLTTVAMKKINYKCDIKSKNDERCQTKSLDMNRKKKRRPGEERRKKQRDLIDGKRTNTDPTSKISTDEVCSLPRKKGNNENSETFIYPSERNARSDEEEEINFYDENHIKKHSKISQTCKLQLFEHLKFFKILSVCQLILLNSNKQYKLRTVKCSAVDLCRECPRFIAFEICVK